MLRAGNNSDLAEANNAPVKQDSPTNNCTSKQLTDAIRYAIYPINRPRRKRDK